MKTRALSVHISMDFLYNYKPENRQPIKTSFFILGSLYYLTTEQQFLGIYLTFYSQLMRTMLNAVIPVPEIYKATWAAHVLAGSFWWRPLGKFLDDLQPSFGEFEESNLV